MDWRRRLWRAARAHTERAGKQTQTHGGSLLGEKVTRSSSYASRRSITKDTYLHLLPRGNSQPCQARNIGNGSLRPITPLFIDRYSFWGHDRTLLGQYRSLLREIDFCHLALPSLPPQHLLPLSSWYPIRKEGRAESHSITLRLSSIYASTRALVSSPGVVIHHSDAAPSPLTPSSVLTC